MRAMKTGGTYITNEAIVIRVKVHYVTADNCFSVDLEQRLHSKKVSYGSNIIGDVEWNHILRLMVFKSEFEKTVLMKMKLAHRVIVVTVFCNCNYSWFVKRILLNSKTIYNETKARDRSIVG